MSKPQKEPRRVASVAPFNADGLLLFGKRNDSGKWTLPGGKLDQGEEPMDGAKRELLEEAGLQGQDLVYLGRGMGGPKGDIVVYCYRALVEGDPDASQDPDEEISEWRWVEPDDIPAEIADNLHAQKNVTLRLLGLQEGEVEEPMQKKADPHFIETRPQSGTAIRIPKAGTRSRKQWDQDYIQAIAQAYTGGDVNRLRHIQVPTDRVFGGNMAVNKSRLALYRRMLKAKDRLPPAVVRRNGMAYDLIDGNHRQQAHKDLGVPMMHAVEILPYDGLKKGLPGLALAAGLTMGGAAPQKPQPAPQAQPQLNQIAQAQGMPKWTPEGLTPEMYPIAHLESSWGKNLAHASNKAGAFHTAFGALGFKPVTAHDEYMKSPYVQKTYPGLNNPEAFLKAFQADPKFYNLLASAHFRRLKERHGGIQQAAYAWRWGTGAARNATPEQIKNDAYVQKFTDMKLDQLGQLVNQPMAKSIDGGWEEAWDDGHTYIRSDDLQKATLPPNPHFERWFGASKMVHPVSGQPQVFYRGTRIAGQSKGRLDTQSFANNPDVASIYAAIPGENPHHGQGANVFPVHLKMENPLDLSKYGPQMTMGDYLREMKFGQENGMTPDEANKVFFYLAKRHQNTVGWDGKGDFSFRVNPEDDEDYDPDDEDTFSFDWKMNSPIYQLGEEFKYADSPEERLRLADRLKADTYALVDSPRTKVVGSRLGHDGVVHHDVFQGVKHAPELLGKQPEQVEGVTQARDTINYKPVHTHVTYRPFKPDEQVRSIHHNHDPAAQPMKPAVPGLLKKNHQDDLDPLEAMLHHDDPRERMMALRSKLVTPYHLRLALQDEDPDVRAMAAKHPMATSALIEEALKHDDLSTREAALGRPDLQDHHLEIALWDPDLQTQAALHPALTEEQRQKLLGNQDTPEGLKTELMAKSIGYLLYPGLDQARPATEPMIRTPKAHDAFMKLTIPNLKRMKAAKGARVYGMVQYNAHSNKPTPPEQRVLRATVGMKPNDSMANLRHETQHAVFASLKQKYGREATLRVVGATIAALDPKELSHLKRITDWNVKNYAPNHVDEERLAYLQNYLQDGTWRRSAHKHMRIHMDQNAQKLSHDWAKQIWKKLRAKAEALTPQEVGVIRKDEELIGQWLTRKSAPDVDYNVYEDMLGLTPKTEAYLEAAKFLGHIEPDRAVFRRALIEDFNLLDAALISVGMEINKENQDALVAVIELQRKDQLHKAEGAHEVLAMMHDGGEVAEGVRRGFGANTEQELHLGGKHSKGSLMVRDPETGQMYLLKPGSGGQSPAKGAKEERANQSRREAAFWHVAEAWGLNVRVPRADLLMIDGKEVAVLHMLPFDWKNLEKLKYKDAGLPHKALEKYRQIGELHKWAILDYVLRNPGRHGQNLMVGPQKEGYPVALIDHGSAFAGREFDPANDKNSFIPYYLRAWRADAWGSMTPQEKLQAMPTVSGDTEQQLRDWFHGINASDLEAVLTRYGIDPAPSLERLAKVKALLGQPNFSEAINLLWMAT